MHFFLPLLLCFVFKRLKKQKRHIPKNMPISTPGTALQYTYDRNVPYHKVCHTDSKSILQYAYILKYQFRDGRLQSVLQIFYSVIVVVFIPQITFLKSLTLLKYTLLKKMQVFKMTNAEKCRFTKQPL